MKINTMNKMKIMQEAYTSPLCTVSGMETQEVLCSSAVQQPANSINDYVEEVYQW